ncbi:MAG: hypothetical protein HEQ14_19915 [Aphanizomenon flos-aquae CP01]|nr:hypothetical protein [Aphanizomenon flos-aquae CP01]
MVNATTPAAPTKLIASSISASFKAASTFCPTILGMYLIERLTADV